MKLSFNWLKEYLTLPQPPEEIAHALTLAGLEEEGIEKKDSDHIFEIGLTPNLGHCMSIVGMARELSAIFNIPLQRKSISFKETKPSTPEQVHIHIEDKEQCHRYGARIVKNIQVAPSPNWLVEKLENSGIRSINNVVDIGNYVMFELGQPLHLFDFDALHEKNLHLRSAKKEGKMTTLDGIEREIPEGSLLVCSGSHPVAFAGVMGEEKSAVTETTQNVLIEAAVFTPQAVRKTSKLLNLRTESSQRFERGIDPLALEAALDFAAHLLSEVAGGEICEQNALEIATPYTPQKLELNTKRANRLLGTQLSLREMATLLGRLEIQVIKETEETLTVQPPSYRNDLQAEIDLIEEVGRLFGFNNIPKCPPKHISSTLTHAPLYVFEEKIREKMVAQGLQECLTCDLIGPRLIEITTEKGLKKEEQIHVLYPASIDQSILRPSLLPGLLEVVKFNLDRQNETIAAFEVGHTHFKQGEHHHSEPSLGIVLTGREAPYHHETKPEEVDFFHIKGHVEDLFSALGIEGVNFSPSHLDNFHPGRQARGQFEEISLVVLGEIHPRTLREMGIERKVYYAEVSLHEIMDLKKGQKKTKALSPFPGSERDWTITLPFSLEIGPLLHELKNGASPLLEEVTLLDIYTSEKLGKEKKNVTFRFQYRDPQKTIEYSNVEKEHKRVTESIAEKLENRVT